jgi:hypothetical protein
MLCKNVLPLLSEFFDEILDADTAVQVSQHLDQCIQCRKELNSLSALHGKLKSLNRIQAPEHLHNLVQHRLTKMERDSWRASLKNELEYYWIQIRSIEKLWYFSRVLGTVMTTLFFMLISSTAISPIVVEADTSVVARNAFTQDYRQQLSQHILAKLGMLKEQPPKMFITKSKPAINNQYLVEYGQSISKEGKDDNFSVAMEVDRSGGAKIQSVLEYPKDQELLSNFNEMMSSAKCRPASKNGRAVPSSMVFTFSKVTVYN